MKILILMLMVVSTSALSATKDDVKNIAKQFENRNWYQHSIKYAREGHLAYYGDLELIQLTKDYNSGFSDVLNSLNLEQTQYFYPELLATDENTPSQMAYQYQEYGDIYQVMEGMDELFLVLDTQRWNDPDDTNCSSSDPVNDADCGRRTKMQWVFSHLNAIQRENLPEFKRLVLSELEEVGKMELGIPAGPEAARMYQLLLDPMSLLKLFDDQYFSYSDDLDPNVLLNNQIAILQAALYQAFVGTSGKLETSELDYVELEDPTCVALSSEQEINECLLDDLKIKFANYKTGATSQTVENLLLDRKFVRAVAESIILNAKDSGASWFNSTDLLEVGDRFFGALGILYGTDYVTYKADVSDQFKTLAKQELMGLGEYLLTTEDIMSLQLSKSLQKLVVYMESEL